VDGRFEGSQDFELVREAINAIRQLRSEYAIPPAQRIHAALDTAGASGRSARDVAIFRDEAAFIQRMARCEITLDEGSSAPDKGATILLSSGSKIRVALADVIDLEKECAKAKTELEKLSTQLEALTKRLANAGFTDRAPANVVESERQKQREWTARRVQLTDKVASLCGS
jgi:valyl-tRNA synthetase